MVEAMNELKEIAQKIDGLGGRAYLVGGYVRDIILGRKSYDIDLCITGLDSVQKFMEQFKKAELIGNSFPVFKLGNIDIAFARKERKVAIGKRGFDVISDSSVTIEEDLKRRDFTINAIAIDILNSKIIDPYGGVEDIRNGKIKAVSEAFSEDPSRVYRGARFSAQLDMEVDASTLNMMKILKPELNSLCPELVFKEFKKALVSKKPTNFFCILKKVGVLDIHFEEIYNLIGVEQPQIYHPEGDVFNHTMESINLGRRIVDCYNDIDIKKKEVIMFGILVHDIGKGITPKDNWPHHYMHDKLGINLVDKMSDRLKLPNKWRLAGKEACEYHMKAGMFYELSKNKQVGIIDKFVSRSVLGLDGLEIVANADKGLRCNGKPIKFAKIGHKMMKLVKLNEKDINNKNPESFKNILLERRIEWLTKNVKLINKC